MSGTEKEVLGEIIIVVDEHVGLNGLLCDIVEIEWNL